MSIGDKLIEVAYNIPLVFEAGEKKHIMRYRAALESGSDTNSISFDCPFEPDFILVASHSTEAQSFVNSVILAEFDRRVFARIGGFFRTRQAGKFSNNAVTFDTGIKCFAWNDGVCTVELLASYGVVFPSNMTYICTAVKYTDKSDRELLSEEILSLEGTGEALEYSKTRVNATVTDAEWQTLIANKPGRTFTLF